MDEEVKTTKLVFVQLPVLHETDYSECFYIKLFAWAILELRQWKASLDDLF